MSSLKYLSPLNKCWQNTPLLELRADNAVSQAESKEMNAAAAKIKYGYAKLFQRTFL